MPGKLKNKNKVKIHGTKISQDNKKWETLRANIKYMYMKKLPSMQRVKV